MDSDTDPLNSELTAKSETPVDVKNEPKEIEVNVKVETEGMAGLEYLAHLASTKPNEPVEVKVEKEKPSRKKGKLPKVPTNSIIEALYQTIPFYGCALCPETKYHNLNELNEHVISHKDRVTSYDLKVKSLEVKLKLKKELKRLKKEKKELAAKKDETANSGTVESGTAVTTVDDKKNGLTKKDKANKISIEIKEIRKKLALEVDEKYAKDKNLEKIFKCGGCDKQFSLGYYLKLHVRSHTGEKPYQCQDCGQTFITASKLNRHRKRTHLSVRYECRICHRQYTRLEFLTNHFNKHHADDKIDGEPYDYNAILPYLKELEADLQKKKEEEQKALEDAQKVFEEAKKTAIGLLPLVTQNETKVEHDWDMPLSELKSSIKKEEVEVKTEADDYYQEPEVMYGGDDFDDTSDREENFDFCSSPVKTETNAASSEVFIPEYLEGEEVTKEVVEKMELRKVKNESADPGEESDFWAVDNDSDEEYFPTDTWSKLPSPSPQKMGTKKTKYRKNADGLVQCNECDKQLKPGYMRIHMRTHTKDRPYKCKACNRGFITASKMNRHFLTHIDDNSAEIANECDVKETDENGKKKRKRRRRNVLPGVNKEYTDDGQVIYNKNGKRPFVCDVCDKRFGYEFALEVHKRTHDEKTPSLVCKYCSTVFDDADSLAAHAATHGGPKPYLCTICGRTYKKKEYMINHRRLHQNEKRYQCDMCPKNFNAQCKLARHLLTHRPDKHTVKYECPVCAHIFNTKYHVEMHLTSHEKEGVIHPENRSQIMAMVMQNIRRIPQDNPTSSPIVKDLLPNDERSRICNICGEIFEHFFLLEQHLKKHAANFDQDDANDRKHVCQICNKGFKLSYYLKLHSYVHTKEKPYVCQQCGKGFITRGKLNRHMETHSGLKKYQCHICCKFFTRPSYLRIHVRTIHGTQDYNFKMDNDTEYPLSYQFALNASDGMSVVSHDSV